MASGSGPVVSGELRTYEAFAPDGTRFTRTTRRVYTHAVVGVAGFGDQGGAWRLCGFHGDPYNAAKRQNEMLGSRWGWERAYVVAARPVLDCPYCAPDERCALHTVGGES